ncbi:hypothetical protein MC7420_4056 [Coleofasciculus chthonoplastes PCC 7420]|uniref:Uncharacterized protein n=1 Tax=Coleofasciculus chthonoplastes PCC 7420 TaxID=118168 RepID=B4VV06_9CYAN|nr:hypothetical protein [Coleofasciculus chthonoplastes]EDX74071.1 hypothetical protein MC7420_4056 [Coleofasciculus chthonoplastes PCC 7420]
MTLAIRNRTKKASLKEDTAGLMLGASGALLTNLVVTTSTFSVAAAAIGASAVSYLVWHKEVSSLLRWMHQINRRYRWQSVLLLTVGGLFILQCMATPANAQFFQSAEDWLGSQFPDAGDVIPLVFNVLRGLFLLYVGIALVRIINAARQDEDWQGLARTPLIIVIAVTVADVVSVLITG